MLLIFGLWYCTVSVLLVVDIEQSADVSLTVQVFYCPHLSLLERLFF